MDKAESWETIDQHRIALADLLETLTPAEWSTPSLCKEWTVRDVAAHMSMVAMMSGREVLTASLHARGNFDRMIRDVSRQRAAARSNAEIVADLRHTVGSRRLAPTTFWRDPLVDILVHTQDIARPVGRRVAMPTEAALTALDWAWQRRFPFFPARRYPSVRMVADDAEWQRGSGLELRGPVASLLLISTGRRSALHDEGLSGPALARLLAQESSSPVESPN